jgi:maltooligosyltrehalose trehalohydrolase
VKLQVADGRQKFLAQFPSIADVRLDDREDPSTFQRCMLDWSERESNPHWPRLFRSLIALWRSDEVIRLQGQHGIDLAVLSNKLFIARMYGEAGRDRLLAFNFGRDFAVKIVPEPLLARRG